MTCYGELGISLWYVFQITKLSTIGKLYDVFILDNKFIMDQRLRSLYGSCSKFWNVYMVGNPRPQFTEWVKEFIPQQLDFASHNNLTLSMEDFKDCGHTANHDIVFETYLVPFLAYWLSIRVLTNASR